MPQNAATKKVRGNSSPTPTALAGRPVASERRASFTVPGLDRNEADLVVEALQDRLCALVDLGLTLKHIHWNVVGPSFIGVHQMLDPQYAGVQLMVDDMAERIATLGGVPSGLPGRIVEHRTWDDYELGRADTQAHLAALDLVYQNLIVDHRCAIDAVGPHDRVSEDMLIGQAGVLEQYHWFVRSHLVDWAGGVASAGAATELDAARAAVRRSGPGAGRRAAGKR